MASELTSLMGERERRRSRVLVVTNDEVAVDGMLVALMAAGYAVRWERDGFEALKAVATWSPTLVALDWGLPFVSGDIFTRTLSLGLKRPPPVVAIAPSTMSAPAAAAGAAAVVSYPVECDQLVEAVTQTLHRVTSGGG